MDIDDAIALDALHETRQKLEIMRGLQDNAIKLLTNFYGSKICDEEGFAGLASEAFRNAKEIVDEYTISIASKMLIKD